MYKKARCTCKVVVLLIKHIAFLTFPLPSPSWFRKVPINDDDDYDDDDDDDDDMSMAMAMTMMNSSCKVYYS